MSSFVFIIVQTNKLFLAKKVVDYLTMFLLYYLVSKYECLKFLNQSLFRLQND